MFVKGYLGAFTLLEDDLVDLLSNWLTNQQV
jgi:hypothetical protein